MMSFPDRYWTLDWHAPKNYPSFSVARQESQVVPKEVHSVNLSRVSAQNVGRLSQGQHGALRSSQRSRIHLNQFVK